MYYVRGLNGSSSVIPNPDKAHLKEAAPQIALEVVPQNLPLYVQEDYDMGSNKCIDR